MIVEEHICDMIIHMNERLSRRTIWSMSALVIILIGVCAPISFGAFSTSPMREYSNTTVFVDDHRVALIQSAYAQSIDDGTDTQNTAKLNDVCGTSWSDAIMPSGIACNIMLWAAKGAYKVSGMLAVAAGGLFDYMLWFTIQSSTYANSDFIETGWCILRDLANIIFIVGLIIAALSIMLSGVVSIGAKDGKKMLAMIIVSALLVNFSLFFSQVIVDASHILARTFYNQMGDGGIIESSENASAGKSHQQLSIALFDKVDPQKLILDDSIISSQSFGWTTVITLYIFITILHLIFIYAFLSMGLLFIGRTVGLMFGMISSPIAFATLGTPLSDTKFVGFHTWLKDLTKNAFMVPVFLFFFYLVVLFTGPAFDGIKASLGDSLSKSLGQKMIDIIIPMSILVGLLMGGKKAASSMASEMASQASSIVGKGVGLLAGSALTVGAGALTMGAGAAGGVLGKGAGKLLKAGEEYSRSDKFGSKILGGTMTKIGSQVGSVSEKVKNANVDVRSSFLGKQAMAGLGAAGIGSMSFGEGKYTTAKAEADKREKEALARAERDAMFRNQEEEKKKKEQAEIIVNAQAEIDDLMSSKAYLEQQKTQEDAIDIVKDDIKAEREELKTLKEAYAQSVATYGQSSNEAKNALGAVKDKESGIKDLEDKEKKLTSALDSGAFYQGADQPEKDDLKKVNDDITKAQNDVNEYRKRDREIKLLENIATRTPAQDADLARLKSEKTNDNASGKNEDSLRKELSEKKEVMKTLADSGNSAAKLKVNREKISDAEAEEKKIDKQMSLNKRRAIKQELDLMNNTFNKISSTLLTGLPGAIIAGVTGGLTGLSFGTMLGAGLLGGGAYAGYNALNDSAHGFSDNDRAKLQEIFRKTTKAGDK